MEKKEITICLVCGFVSLVMFGTVIAEEAKGSDTKGESAAVKAYELRMDGKIEDAQKLLEKTLAENPKDAAAYYELARIQMHMALGGGKMENLVDMMRGAQKNAEMAVELNPKNITYASFAGNINFMQAYYGLMTGGQPKAELARAIGAFESALKSKPDHYQTLLYLVELYSDFPEEVGGDKSKAEQYAKQLEAMDEVYGAKARSMLLPENVDRIDYWQKVLKKHQDNAEVIEELGKAYLREDKVDEAVSYFKKAIEIDPEKASLFLDLSIYYTFGAMGAGDDKELFQRCIKSGDEAVTRYIKSGPVQPMLAYALGVQSKYKFFSGNKEQGQALFKQAEALDPYFSKATGAPHPDLFIRPGEVSQNHRYLMRRF
ncbi:MAG: tetratricopeptide repeat protein [Sedimentisphaerales bacterium]|nr:tetratricopeptide repeat protein [Sedimentisphaerales bacterium]